MFEIKSFVDFKNAIRLNEAAGSDVWKFDADRPGAGEGGKFTFKAKVQYTEDSQSESEIGDRIADFMISSLQNTVSSATTAFKQKLASSDWVPVISARRNTSGGFFTGGRGVLTGSIIFLDKKFYSDADLANLPAFKPLGKGKEIIVDGKKIYDIEVVKSAKEKRETGKKPEATPAAPQAASQTTTTTTAPVAQAAAAQAATAQAPQVIDTKPLTSLFVGLKQADKNYKIETLQGLLNKLPVNANQQITVDGNYGTRTGGAIARAIGQTNPILTIDQATADKLTAEFNKLAGIKVEDLLTAAKKEGVPPAALQYTVKKPAAKKSAPAKPKSRTLVD
jgi:hypothetical protein